MILWASKRFILIRWVRLLNLTGTAQPPTHPCSLSQIMIVFSTCMVQAYKVTGRRCMCLSNYSHPWEDHRIIFIRYNKIPPSYQMNTIVWAAYTKRDVEDKYCMSILKRILKIGKISLFLRDIKEKPCIFMHTTHRMIWMKTWFTPIGLQQKQICFSFA